jgi:arylformamidase
MNSHATGTAARPRVYLDYDQEALDRAYDQAAYAPNMQALAAQNAADSNDVRRRIGEPKRFAYGNAEVEQLDVYTTDRPNAPIQIYIHGGAWRTQHARNYAFGAETFVKAGAHYVIPDFAGVETMDGQLPPILNQIRRAVAWTYANADKFGGDRSRFHVLGHSSGAHMNGLVLLTDWSEFGLPKDIITGGTCCSGMYDLHPVSLSARSRYVKFDAAMIDAMSAIRHIDQLRCPLTLAYGTSETPEFQRQARDYAAALTNAGKKFRLVIGKELNHFEMPRTLADPSGLLARAALEQIGLASS